MFVELCDVLKIPNWSKRQFWSWRNVSWGLSKSFMLYWNANHLSCHSDQNCSIGRNAELNQHHVSKLKVEFIIANRVNIFYYNRFSIHFSNWCQSSVSYQFKCFHVLLCPLVLINISEHSSKHACNSWQTSNI